MKFRTIIFGTLMAASLSLYGSLPAARAADSISELAPATAAATPDVVPTSSATVTPEPVETLPTAGTSPFLLISLSAIFLASTAYFVSSLKKE